MKEETMDEMIELVYLLSQKKSLPDEETARQALKEIFPNKKVAKL